MNASTPLIGLKPFPELTSMQWNKFCDFGMAEPVPLEEADLTKSFVYERCYGLFYVPGGMHISAMSLLLAIQHGCQTGMEVAGKLGLKYSSGTADYWLEHTPGAAFRSSVSKRIQVGTSRGMTIQERRLFTPATFVFD